MLKNELVDYRSFRPDRLNDPEFRHIKYLIFWPIYGIFFAGVERFWIRDYYVPVHCALDDAIPFCEYFLIAYMFWFVFLVGMLVYTFFFDTQAFSRMMRFIIMSYSVTILVYILYPTCQELRPEVFPRDNALTRFIAGFYQFDTNTNVCPSIHVIGSLAVLYGSWDARHLDTPVWRTVFTVLAVLISVSTVFVKQHSVIDLVAALPLSAFSALYASRRLPAVRTVRERERNTN